MDAPAGPELETLSFEAALKELEAIVARLETGDEELQTAIDLYARGDALRQHCAARLEAAQMRIEQVRADANGRATGTQPFAAG